MEFKIRFGAAKISNVKANSERNVPDPQDNWSNSSKYP